MELKSVHVFGNCYEPNQGHNNNYMFDTTAINKLAERPQDISILTAAQEKLGYEYFLCRIQKDEIIGRKGDGTFHPNFSADNEKAKQMNNIIEVLQIRQIPCLAKFVQRGILSNGTDFLKNSNGNLYNVFINVYNGNPENLEDAMIVESGIRYNCTVLSNDKAMCTNARLVFPDKIKWYERFIQETEAILNSKL